MVKDTFNSILDNIKERTTNPFLGTLIVVWLFKNWKLVYSLIYFDSKLTLKARLDYIDVYFKDTNFLWNLFYTILITLGVLTLTYALLSVSRLLTDTYDRIVIPWLSKVTDKNSVVLKTVHNALQEEYRNLEKRLEEERLAKVAAQKERDDAYLKIADIASNVQENLESDKNQEDITITTDLKPAPLVKKALDKYNNENDIPLVNDVIHSIRSSHSVDNRTDIVKYLLRMGLISLKQRSNTPYFAFYEFTDEGTEFANYWNNVVD